MILVAYPSYTGLYQLNLQDAKNEIFSHICKYAHIFKYANLQVCKYASMQLCMYASMQAFKYASIHNMHINAKLSICLQLRPFFAKFGLGWGKLRLT